MTEMVDKGITSNTFKKVPKPLPEFKKSRLWEFGLEETSAEALHQREKEWREAAEYYKGFAIFHFEELQTCKNCSFRTNIGFGRDFYKEGRTGLICQSCAIKEAFGEEK